jgi:hypothetical protein
MEAVVNAVLAAGVFGMVAVFAVGILREVGRR